MRVRAIAPMALATILTVAAPHIAGSQPGGKGDPKHPSAKADFWDYERTRINENGFYPVPEFLRAPESRAPRGRPNIQAQRSATGIAYPTARQLLIRQGFVPVKVAQRGDGTWMCDGGRSLCHLFPEVLDCSGAGMEYCAFLYQHRRTGKYWIISTAGEEGEPPDFKQLRCCGYRPATKSYLEDLVILRPNGRQFRFQYPHPSEADITPLCSETKGQAPCWIKAPPDYRK